MKMSRGGLGIVLGILSSSVSAEVMVNVDGVQYALSALMENCQSMGDNPTDQIACFNAVSKLLDQQAAEPEEASTSSVPEALEALRSVAQYDNGDSGLIVQGTECKAHIIYYANYFHVSRRNVSSIDVFSVQFDASEISQEQINQAASRNAFVSKVVMQPGAVAKSIAGEAIESAQFGIAPKSARTTIADYAVEVADQLSTNQSGEFDFVLVHPAKQQSGAEIWSAFEAYVQECQRALIN